VRPRSPKASKLLGGVPKFARLETEHDNLRAALGWALQNREAELGARLALSVWWFWIERGYLSDGRRWIEALLALDPSGEPGGGGSARAHDGVPDPGSRHPGYGARSPRSRGGVARGGLGRVPGYRDTRKGRVLRYANSGSSLTSGKTTNAPYACTSGLSSWPASTAIRSTSPGASAPWRTRCVGGETSNARKRCWKRVWLWPGARRTRGASCARSPASGAWRMKQASTRGHGVCIREPGAGMADKSQPPRLAVPGGAGPSSGRAREAGTGSVALWGSRRAARG
jgi:hypothetical protein